MVFDLILKNISQHIELDKAETDCFASLITSTKVTKKTLILSAGQACNTLNYVHSGMLRAYHLGKDGKESTIMFAVADWWITDMFCFLNKKPAMVSIEAIKDSHLCQLSYEHFEKLLYMVPKFERFFRILMQNAYTREQLRVLENLSLSAEERYVNFLIKYPYTSKVVTQKQIASYLGITPEFLSKIRKNKR